MLDSRTPRTRLTALPIAPLVACLLIIPITAAAQCPMTTLTCSGTDPYGATVFYLAQTASTPVGSVAFGKSSASYDLVAGRLNAIAEVEEAHKNISRVVASDIFQLHNVKKATFTIRLNLSFSWVADNYRMAFAAAYAHIEAKGESAEASSIGPGLGRFIEIEITAHEGVPFVITYELEASGWGYYPLSTMSARLEFLGLPEGAGITSCNGFSGAPVSVEESSWGNVKALYR